MFAAFHSCIPLPNTVFFQLFKILPYINFYLSLFIFNDFLMATIIWYNVAPAKLIIWLSSVYNPKNCQLCVITKKKLHYRKCLNDVTLVEILKESRHWLNPFQILKTQLQTQASVAYPHNIAVIWHPSILTGEQCIGASANTMCVHFFMYCNL